ERPSELGGQSLPRGGPFAEAGVPVGIRLPGPARRPGPRRDRADVRRRLEAGDDEHVDGHQDDDHEQQQQHVFGGAADARPCAVRGGDVRRGGGAALDSGCDGHLRALLSARAVEIRYGTMKMQTSSSRTVAIADALPYSPPVRAVHMYVAGTSVMYTGPVTAMIRSKTFRDMWATITRADSATGLSCGKTT